MNMAVPKLLNSSFMVSASPMFWRPTLGGSDFNAGKLLASASKSPKLRPFNSTSIVTLRLRSKRSICAGPLPILILATLSKAIRPRELGICN